MGRKFSIANRRRQSGNVETYSDLLIQSGGSDVEEGSMALVREEGDGDQQATGRQGGYGLLIQKGEWFHHPNGALWLRCLMLSAIASPRHP